MIGTLPEMTDRVKETSDISQLLELYTEFREYVFTRRGLRKELNQQVRNITLEIDEIDKELSRYESEVIAGMIEANLTQLLLEDRYGNVGDRLPDQKLNKL